MSNSKRFTVKRHRCRSGLHELPYSDAWFEYYALSIDFQLKLLPFP